jgi:predicted anti-sigma-YlaC factor YlaD
MNCNEAAEFVSALCDGETVSPAAAEHIGECPGCRDHLQEYLAMGAELRRVASLEPTEEARTRSWHNNQRPAPSWWTKGRESMRIPRFAFALLLITIVALGSGLVVVRARAHT